MQIIKSRYRRATIAVAVLAGAGALAHAGTNAANDAIAIDNAKVSMTQAIAAAEQNAGGKATQAEYQTSKAGGAYYIEVVSGARVVDVKVDATSGAVLSATPGARDENGEDRDGEAGEHDDQGEHGEHGEHE